MGNQFENDTHTVEVTFTANLSEYDSAEEFVEDCLTGNRSNKFALSVDNVEEVDSD